MTETLIPSTSGAYVAVADNAMEDGDFDVALLLYEEAVRRDPLSQVALSGRLIAFAESRDLQTADIDSAGLN